MTQAPRNEVLKDGSGSPEHVRGGSREALRAVIDQRVAVLESTSKHLGDLRDEMERNQNTDRAMVA